MDNTGRSEAVTNNAAAVRAAGLRQPPIGTAERGGNRPSTRGDDHLSRVRIAATLGASWPRASTDQYTGTGTRCAGGRT